MTLSVVIWKWRPEKAIWTHYTSDAVNHLANQIHRFIGIPHKVFCITDDAAGLDSSIEVVALQDMPCPMPAFNQYSHRLHSAYRRLKIFDPAIGKYFGQRLLQLDVDMVITGDISGIINRREPFLIWKCHSGGRRQHALNPSFILMDVGAKAAVDIWKEYCDFPDGAASAAYSAGWTGTEQAIIGYLTRNKEPPILDARDGIYAFRDNRKECGGNELAAGVKVVSFHGDFNPADPALQKRCKWLARAWKESRDHVRLLPVGQEVQGGIRQHPEADDRPQLHGAT